MRTWIKDLLGRIGETDTMAYAQSMAFNAMVALSPLLVVLVSVLSLVDAGRSIDSAVNELGAVLPEQVVTLVAEDLTELARERSGVGIGLGGALAVLIAIYGASGMVRALMLALNRTYNIDERRGILQRYGASALAVLVLAGGIGSALLAMAAGDHIATALGVGDPDGVLRVAVHATRWLLGTALLLGAITAIYRLLPAASVPVGVLSAGTFGAAIGLVLFASAFTWYVENFGSYNATYGSLASAVVLLLYLQYSAFVLLAGAHINVLTDGKRVHHLGRG